MSDRFDDDMMDDLMAEPDARGHSAMDEFEDAAEFDAGDEFEESADFGDESAFEAADEFDGFEEAGDAFDGEEAFDEFEEAMADALEAEGADEFFGKIGSFLKKVGRGVGSVARVVAPIASAIPLPQAQLIGRAAGLIGNVMADEGDEMDAFDDLADYAEEEDALDALAPAIAAVAIRKGLKHQAAHLPRLQRRQLVKTVTAVTRHIARKHGPRAVMAVPLIVAHARKLAAHKHLPARALPRLVSHTARTALKSPRTLRKLVQTGTRLRHARIGHRGAHVGSALAVGRSRTHGRALRYGHGAYYAQGHRPAAAGTCTHCGKSRTLRFNGPIRLTIEAI